jgi:hypothetical protein
MSANLDEIPIAQLVGDELGAVGRDPNKPPPSLAFAVGERYCGKRA